MTGLAKACITSYATLFLAFPPGSLAEDESKHDANYKQAANEITTARLQEAERSYWNDNTGFSMRPDKLEDEVKGRDSDKIKQLDKKYPTVWKSVDVSFAEAYVRRQQPINDRQLPKAAELRKLINGAIRAAVKARGGGSTSGTMEAFAAAETEWILRQVSNEENPEIAAKSFEKKFRSNVFYVNGNPSGSEESKAFSHCLALLKNVEQLLTPEQQSVLRKEVLDYFE
jgi:hypothetical protein